MTARFARAACVRIRGKSKPGTYFAHARGTRANGADFAADAVRKGAVALLVDRGVELPALGVPLHRRERRAACDGVRGGARLRPAEPRARPRGMTGTNGKTTTAILVEHALNALGRKPARLGTLGFAFRGVAAAGCSHDARSRRRFAPARERRRRGRHRLRHGGFESRARSGPRRRAHLRRRGVHESLAGSSRLSHVDGSVRCREGAPFHRASPAGLRRQRGRSFRQAPRQARRWRRVHGRPLRVGERSPGQRHGGRPRHSRQHRDSPGHGDHRVAARRRAQSRKSAAWRSGSLVGLGFDAEAAAAALGSAPQVPGRLERCDDDRDDIRVLVDYAHTPDALERVLAARARASRRAT